MHYPVTSLHITLYGADEAILLAMDERLSSLLNAEFAGEFEIEHGHGKEERPIITVSRSFVSRLVFPTKEETNIDDLLKDD